MFPSNPPTLQEPYITTIQQTNNTTPTSLPWPRIEVSTTNTTQSESTIPTIEQIEETYNRLANNSEDEGLHVNLLELLSNAPNNLFQQEELISLLSKIIFDENKFNKHFRREIATICHKAKVSQKALLKHKNLPEDTTDTISTIKQIEEAYNQLADEELRTNLLELLSSCPSELFQQEQLISLLIKIVNNTDLDTSFQKEAVEKYAKACKILASNSENHQPLLQNLLNFLSNCHEHLFERALIPLLLKIAFSHHLDEEFKNKIIQKYIDAKVDLSTLLKFMLSGKFYTVAIFLINNSSGFEKLNEELQKLQNPNEQKQLDNSNYLNDFLNHLVQKKCFDVAITLIELGVYPAHFGEENLTLLLQYAVLTNNNDAAMLFIQNGANPNVITEIDLESANGESLNTLLQDAVGSNYFDLAIALILQGASLESLFKNVTENDYNLISTNLLSNAILKNDYKAVKKLIESAPNILKLIRNNSIFISLAIQQYQSIPQEKKRNQRMMIIIIEFLMQNSADYSACSESELQHLMMLAARNFDDEYALAVIKHIILIFIKGDIITTDINIISIDNINITDLVNIIDQNGNSLLMLAIFGRNQKTAKWLIEHSANTKHKNPKTKQTVSSLAKMYMPNLL